MDSQYQLKLESKETGRIYEFQSADGLILKNSFRKEELLLADKIEVDQGDNILVLQSNYGFLGIVLGDKAGKVTMVDTSARACNFSDINAESNRLENYKVENLSSVRELDEDFDKIVYVPASYEPVDLVKHRIREATRKLKPEGEFFIAGKKKTGIKRYVDYLSQAGEIQKIGKIDSIQAYRYSSNDSELEEIKIEKNFKAELDGFKPDFESAEGLFSSSKLDEGTRILLENIELNNPQNILDVACGYGAISVFLAQSYDAKLFLTDDNTRATSYALKNMEDNRVESFQVETADCLDAYQNHKFDVIVSNPPTHQGKGVTQKIFRQAYECLEKGGGFWIVYNQNMNFEDELLDLFNSVDVLAEENNFLVVEAIK